MVVNKCHITSIALDEISSLFYGIKCKDNSMNIIENYISSLSCPDLPSQTCYPDVPCENSPIIFNCTFNILRSELEIQGNNLTFTINPVDYVGGVAPYSYLWTFEPDDFAPAGPINQSSTVLILKPLKDLSNLVSRVSITITDANGCTDTKTCWVNKGVLKCSTNFHPCPNPKSLRLINNVVHCPIPHNLRLN